MSNNDGLSIGKNMAWNSFGSLVYLGCNWLTTVLVVIIYPTYEASGCLASAMAVGNVVATIVLFKVRAFQVSDIEKQFRTSDYVFLRIVCSIAGVAFGFFYALISVSSSAFAAALTYSLFKVLDSFVDVFHGVDQCHNRLDIAGISQAIRGVLVLVCFTSISLFTQDLILAIAGMAFSTLAVVVLFDLPATKKLEAIRLEADPKAVAYLVLACGPGFVSSIFATMVVSLSRQLFGLSFGDDQLGIYAAIATPAVIVQAMASYIYAPLLGPIATAFFQRNFKKVKLIITKFFSALAAITLTVSALFLLIADPLFNLLFGKEIAEYSYLIQPVLLSTSLTAAELFMLDMLIVFRRSAAAIFTCVLSFAIAVIAIYPLSNAFGMNGISFTICLAYICGIGASLVFVLHELSHD